MELLSLMLSPLAPFEMTRTPTLHGDDSLRCTLPDEKLE